MLSKGLMCNIEGGLKSGCGSLVKFERRKEMKGQKSLRYLLVTTMLVVSMPVLAVGQLHEVLIDVTGMT